MGLKSCSIQLDNPWNTYYTGQTVNGQVVFTFDSIKTVRGIIIRVRGEANTSWSETDNDGETDRLHGHEEYFQIQYYLLGGKRNDEIEMPPGTHTYPFTYALPPTLPSSFEGEFGHVRYTIKITLDRPWKFDQDSKIAFTIISPVDLNLNPLVQNSFKLELEKTFCCFCCRSGPLSVVAHVPVTGYVSGQIIALTAECDNASNVHINLVKFILRKLIAYSTGRPRHKVKKVNTTISELSVGPVGPNDSKTWTQQLQIPPLPSSNLTNCGIIDLDYDLQILLEVSGPHINLQGSIPIILGTIPLTSYKSSVLYTDVPAQNLSLAPTKPVSLASPPNGAGGALGWNMADSGTGQLYPNILPPALAESQFKPTTIADKHDTEYTQIIGNGKYAPRYPTYTQQSNVPHNL